MSRVDDLPRFDICIIGGGISGLGVAQAAAQAGLHTVLLERAGCCQATSANSLRIIHGGLRYLQKLQLLRVLTSLKAQSRLLKAYPDLIEELPCLMPLNRHGLKSKFPVSLAISCYSAIAALMQGGRYQGGVLNSEDVIAAVPFLSGVCQHGLLQWTDAQVNDPRAMASVLMTEVQSSGAQVFQKHQVDRVERGNKLYTVHCSNGVTFAARTVVNTSGAWLRSIETDFKLPDLDVSWARAFNLIIDRSFESRYGVGISYSGDRLFFVTPRNGGSGADQLAVGTWYAPLEEGDDLEALAQQDIVAALDDINQSLPELRLSVDEVVGIEQGILPARGFSNGEVDLYGAEKIFDHRGYIEVLSTKYTTFQTQGRRVIRRAKRYL